ncbi:MAG: GNAT family N-acetyltransferase [Phycisphaerales bacterium]|nr:GNAT family N-acetyltransferase [Phycisphaerales bacterium]
MSSDTTPATGEPRIKVSDLEIRRFERGDVARLPKLLKECLGRTVEPSYLEWKFFGGPYTKDLGFFVALHEGEIVAFIGANPVPYAVDGELSLIYQHQDTAIREDCRSLALLRAMTEGVEQAFSLPSVRLTYSITTPHMRALVTKRMKYTVVWEDLKLVKLISLRGMVSKATKSAALASMLPGPMTRSWKAPASMTGDIAPVDRFGADFDQWWKEARKPGENGRIFGWGESHWLNYKFRTDAAVPFKCFAYREAGQVIGCVVLNITRLDVRICYIDMLWTLPARQDVVDLLLSFALHEAASEKCDQVAAWSQEATPLGRAMLGRGFARRPTSQCISVKQVQPNMGDLGLKGEHWNMQRGHTYYTSVGHLEAEEGTQRLYQAKESRDQDRAERLRDQK